MDTNIPESSNQNPVPLEPTNVSKKHWALPVKLLGVIGLVLILVFLGWWARGRYAVVPMPPKNLPDISSGNEQLPVPTPSPELIDSGTQKPEVWLTVEWYTKPKDRTCSDKNFTDCIVVGKLLSGEYTGKELVLELEPGLGTILHYHPLISQSELGPDFSAYESKIIYKFKGLDDAPEEISLPNSDYKFKKVVYSRAELFANLKIVVKLFDHPTLGGVYLMDNGCIMVKLPDQTALSYDLIIPFVNRENGQIDFTFSSGQKNSETYVFNRITGCGALCYYLAVSDSELKPQERLKAVGKTANAEEIFELLNSNDPSLKALYEDENTVAYYSENYQKNGLSKYSYQEFLSYKPLLYWKDPLGRWIEFKNQRFIPAAEMCKPVIYLYPTKPTDLTVKVFPNGGFTYTNPPYNQGWKVTAYPDGRILEKQTNQFYPYLFWEGVGLNYPLGEEGWVVEQKDVKQFLQDMLPKLGLLGREQEDFMEYWTNRLTERPFYRLSFLKQEQFNEIAPLKFEGEIPDSFIRVLMTAKGLSERQVVYPQILPQPQTRHGFVLVEWGGVVLR